MSAAPPPHAPPQDRPLLTVEQVAERLGTPVRFVRRLIAGRRIAFVRVGRYVRIEHDELEAFIQTGHIEAMRID
jgi:excisionase family DNA binding protein